MLSDEALTGYMAELLEAWGIGSRTPAAGVPLLAPKRLPAHPDVGVGITVYLGDDALDASTRRVQFWFRGAPGDVFAPDRLAQLVFDRLHMQHHDGHVSRARRESFASLGLDGNGRDERSDNYEITLRPERTTP